ncbi:type VI secretion system amidase immunity protein Tai4 [Burkholderia ubonensis]|uniref:type VI secretion system amidase immunity protein Tai4 n=1 Tax=Burkholderia ubonensis TaxID=101571 RepID=UPI0009B30DBB|nr:type VI secretion system amidase immunity protein Tai4 [Burkholderia ubonensis]
MKRSFIVLLAMFALMTSTAYAKDHTLTSPQAGARTYAQNYRDMILATCIANAYKNDRDAPVDAGSSASALRDWTSFDMEKSPDAVKSLVDRYLARDYRNPLVESEIKGVRFDFLKCLDLYHSKELDSLVKRLVIDPGRTYRQDNASPAARK